LAINASGEIIGYYTDAGGLNHGFLLSGGQYTTLDDPHAGTGAGQGTFPEGITASGVIVGQYIDANGVHGFELRKGQYTALDDPAGVQGSGANGTNDSGQVAGSYNDANGVMHGYLLTGGRYRTFDDPAGVQGSSADAINDSGQVVGLYYDAAGDVHGYLATKEADSPIGGSDGSAIGSGATAALPSVLFAQDQALNGTGAVLSNNTAWEAGGLSHEAPLAADASAVAEPLITATATAEDVATRAALSHSPRNLLPRTNSASAAIIVDDSDAFLWQ
jgi:uncharacterized membrane protein